MHSCAIISVHLWCEGNFVGYSSTCTTLYTVEFEAAEEIDYLQKNLQIKTSFKLLGLFMNKVKNFDLLRVGGRLESASIPKDRKHPILLPNCNFIVTYIRHLHVTNYHAGPKALVAFSRQKFWVVNANSIVHSCYIRYRLKLMEQVVGNASLQQDHFKVAELNSSVQ